MVFDYHGYALGPGGDNFPNGRNFVKRGDGRTVLGEHSQIKFAYFLTIFDHLPILVSNG